MSEVWCGNEVKKRRVSFDPDGIGRIREGKTGNENALRQRTFG